MRLCGVFVAIVLQYMHAPSTAQQVERVASKAARHATTSAQSKHFGEQARGSEMPKCLWSNTNFVNLSGSDHVIILLTPICFVERGGPPVARAKNRHPPTAPLLCQAYSVLLKRRQHLLLLLLLLPSIPLDLSSPFCPCGGRVSVCLEIAS